MRVLGVFKHQCSLISKRLKKIIFFIFLHIHSENSYRLSYRFSVYAALLRVSSLLRPLTAIFSRCINIYINKHLTNQQICFGIRRRCFPIKYACSQYFETECNDDLISIRLHCLIRNSNINTVTKVQSCKTKKIFV